MSKFSIYSKDGSVIRYAGEPKYTGTFMGVSYIEFSSIDSPAPIPWERGDYVDYYRIGKRFRLYSLPEPKKQARKGENGASFIYSNVKFYASTKDLEIAPFRDLVPADNDIHFSTRPDVSTYESVYGIAARIKECMDDIFPGKWAIEVFDTSDSDLLALFNEQKEFSVSNGSCLDALSQIYEVWKNVGWIHTYDSARGKEVITIGRTILRDSENTSDSYAYGIGNGLTSLKKAAANEDEFATRLYVYGSERNIQTRYYNGLNIHDKDSVNIVNLMIPPEKWGKTDGLPDARKAYLQADDAIIEKYGLIPRTVYFDGNENEEIYPSITGLTCAEVRAEMLASGVPANRPDLPPDNSERIDLVVSAYGWTTGDKEETEKYPTFDMHLRQMGFNIADQGKLTSEGMATISMKSGACAGREFKVKSYALDKNNQPYLSVEKSWDDSLGMSFPNGLYPIVTGDQFVLLDIPMPDYYITLAQKRLLEAGERLLSDYTRVSPYYEPSVDSFKIKKGAKILQEGMYMQVYDKDIIDTEDNRDYILIDSLSIDEKGDMPTYKVTLREQKRSGRTFGTLEGMIEDAKKSTDDEIKRQRIYTDRRFRSAQETISMLQEAFDGYTEGINPVTIETMSLLVGNEALQFKFTATRDSLSAVPCPLSYNNDTKQLSSVPASLIHLTLGIDAITTQSMPAGSYMSWDLPEWYSAQLDDPSKRYYVYAKVSVTAGGEATYLLSETAIGMSEVEGYYHLLIGIINSEYVGVRDFVAVYGFTEVLPGQITTDIIRDADSNLIIDLLNATITARNGARIIGDVEFGTNSTGLSNLSEWQSLESEVSGLGVSIQKVQDQVDGVVENWNGNGPALLTEEPAKSWIDKGDAELIAHINDTYINIEKYENDVDTPTAGHAWRWCQCGESEGEGNQQVVITGPLTQGEWVKVGQLDVSYNYNYVVSPNGKIEFAYDQEITIISGPPTYIKVDRSGAIYLLDNYSYFVGSNSITLLFEYADYTIAHDKDDNLIKLHWHPIADSDAVRALKDAAEATKIASEASRLNLLANSAEVVVPAIEDSNYNYLIFPLPIGVSTGDTLTFKAEKADALIGDFTQFTLRLMNSSRTDDYIPYSTKVDVGENVTLTFTVTKQGLTYAPAVLLIYAGLVDYTAGKSLRVEHFSLVKGSTAMSSWQDYQGDNGLKNILEDSESLEISGSGTYSHMQYFMSYPLKGGEQYTFMCEEATISEGNEYEILLYTQDSTGAVTGYYGQFVMNTGSHQYKTFTIPKDTPDSYIFGIYSGRIGAANKTLRLTRFSLVKGTRPMMTWKQNTDYLTNAFKNGTTKISGGLTMAQAVMVEDENGTVRGMLNGSDYAEDATHGKLILAAGSEGALAPQLAEATTRIYEKGKIISKDVDLEGKITATSGSFTGSITATSFATSGFAFGNATIDSIGFHITNSVTDKGTHIDPGYIEVGTAMRGYTGSNRMTSLALIMGTGMIEGMRPKTRTLNSGTLSSSDHTIIVTSETATIYLPSSPVAGMEFRICKRSNSGTLTINGNGKSIYNMWDGTTGTTFVSTNSNMIDIVWDGTYWLANYGH